MWFRVGEGRPGHGGAGQWSPIAPIQVSSGQSYFSLPAVLLQDYSNEISKSRSAVFYSCSYSSFISTRMRAHSSADTTLSEQCLRNLTFSLLTDHHHLVPSFRATECLRTDHGYLSPSAAFQPSLSARPI